MNAFHKRRLMGVSILICCVALAAFLIMTALKANINFFYTPTQIMQNEAPNNTLIRLGGMVEKGSLVRGENLQVLFTVTDFTHKIQVSYNGILPDLFKEGQGIVALGLLTSHNHFLAREVLAKHDENYMPPGVSTKNQRRMD